MAKAIKRIRMTVENVGGVDRAGWHLDQAGGMTPQMLFDAVRVFGDREPIFRKGLVGMAHRFILGPDEVPAGGA